MLIVYVVAGLLLSLVAYAAATAVAGHLAGLRVARLTLGAGPSLLSADIAGTTLQVAPLPLSSSVQFQDQPSRNLEGLPLLQNLAVQLAGPAGMGVLAAALLGSEAVNVVASVWMGVFSLLGPAADESIRTAILALKAADPLRVMGLMAAANTAVQLLPLPPLPLGMAAMRVMFGRNFNSAAARWVLKAGLLACLVLLVLGGVALFSVLRGG